MKLHARTALALAISLREHLELTMMNTMMTAELEMMIDMLTAYFITLGAGLILWIAFLAWYLGIFRALRAKRRQRLRNSK
jgi:hypothetical protein